jgi:hypothetical protein
MQELIQRNKNLFLEDLGPVFMQMSRNFSKLTGFCNLYLSKGIYI